MRSSHERWDGAGYPDGLSGEAIPFGARIVFACDAFEAMTSARRPYRVPLAPAAALGDELSRCAGTQFDPRVVAALVGLVRDEMRDAAAGAVTAVSAADGAHARSGGGWRAGDGRRLEAPEVR